METGAAIAAERAGGGLDFVSLFLHADPVVKAIMLGLLVASFVCWAIMVEKSLALWWQRRTDLQTLSAFRSRTVPPRRGTGAAHIMRRLDDEAPLSAGWHDAVRERFLARARLLLGTLKRERERGVSVLATVASAGPFIGLFGTVWGIMNSFAAIAESKNTSLDVVAPGIAEALLATAIGLFAAIPAAVFYNRLTSQVGRSLVPAEELVQEMLILRAGEAAAR
ncbi:MotA/TolQ/ExbB proton channel family protein [Aestuariivirga sp.]|uniref:MotA/TolQ/ExbB proton channel family protein n=1 Tax=Aestuariivirga sp. TaxID=2650926 RepID=UPI0039E58776